MAGFLDALIGAHTNDASNQALNQQIPYLWGATSGANDILTKTTATGNADLTGATARAGAAIGQGYDNAYSTLGSAGGQAQNILNGRTDQAAGVTAAGNDAFRPAAAMGGAASTMYGNALGLNGAAGNAAATSAFRASPGYQYSVDQATDAAARKASALGVAGSGSTLDAITRLGSNLADQEYNNWTSGLSNLATQGLSAASGIAANQQAAGKLYGTAGTTGAALEQSLGSSLGNAQVGKGVGLGSLEQSLGQELNSNDTTLGRLISNNNINTQNTIFGAVNKNAQQQDAATSANNGILSGIIGGLGKTLMGGFGL